MGIIIFNTFPYIRRRKRTLEPRNKTSEGIYVQLIKHTEKRLIFINFSKFYIEWEIQITYIDVVT